MKQWKEVLYIVRGLLDQRTTLDFALGADAAEFRRRLEALVRRLDSLSPAELERAVAELIVWARTTPASAVVDRIVRTARHKAEPVRGSTPEESIGGIADVQAALRELARASAAESAGEDGGLSGGADKGLSVPDAPSRQPEPDAWRGTPLPMPVPVPRPDPSDEVAERGAAAGRRARRLNAGVFQGDAPVRALVAPDRPLLLAGGPYWLGVDIGEKWGIGDDEHAFPDATLARAFAAHDALSVDIVAFSKTATISPEIQRILLPATGTSERAYFLVAFPDARRHVINIDVVLNGHLLQTRRIWLEVAEREAEARPSPQTSEVLFTRIDDITEEQVMALAASPRRLTLLAERRNEDGGIDLRAYRAGPDQELVASLSTGLDSNSLTQLLKDTRAKLRDMMLKSSGAGRRTEAALLEQLVTLAHVGQSLYNALFPELSDLEAANVASRRLAAQLEPGVVIQVAPLSTRVSVPWELLYERPLAPDANGRFSLCAHCLAEGADARACPHANETSVICPLAFWGFRYIIEQLPCRCEGGACVKPPLPRYVRNHIPMRFTALVSKDFDAGANSILRKHLSGIADMAQAGIELKEGRDVDVIRALLADQTTQLLYFYAHGGHVQGKPVLRVGDNFDVVETYLRAWKVKLDANNPLVVLNACQSGDYTPDDYESLIEFFMERGASGLIGTQCGVFESVAADFMNRFLAAFFAQDAAGQALFRARTSMLRENLDARGLVYSLFATADLKLAQRVIGRP